MPTIDRAVGFVDAVDPDLRGLQGHGGKLLLYHGWSDPWIPPKGTIEYYVNVLEEMGSELNDWMRLFMVPGMSHCSGGNGPYSFDIIGAIVKWREEGIPPDQMMGSNPQTGLTRPLCPFPQYAEYDGSGSLSNGSNWKCSDP